MASAIPSTTASLFGARGHAPAQSSPQKIIDTLRDSFETSGAPASRLLDASGLTKPTFYRALSRLGKADVIVNEGTRRRTHYVLAETSGQPWSH